MAVTLKSRNDGGRLDAMESRVKKLEDETSEIRSDLKTLLIGFAEIKGTLKGLASAELVGDLKGTIGDLKGTVGELKGRVDALPTLANVSSAIGIATTIMLILNNWSLLKAWLVH